MKHCSMMYSGLAINFLNHFKCFCGFKNGFPAGQNRQVTPHRKYMPHCEQFELKLGMRREEGLLTNFPKFHGDGATSTCFRNAVTKLTGQTLYFFLIISYNTVVALKFMLKLFPFVF